MMRHCDHADKTTYTSKRTARLGLPGGLRSKSVRIYACEHCHGYHITKDFRSELRRSVKSSQRTPRKNYMESS